MRGRSDIKKFYPNRVLHSGVRDYGFYAVEVARDVTGCSAVW